MSEERLGRDLETRLRAELDRVQPPNTSPRYLATRPRATTLRLAPALLGASVIAILALSAFVATGSPNPAVWGRDVVTIIQSSSTTPTPSPSASSHAQPPVTNPTHEPGHESPRPTEGAEPSEPPEEEHQSPETSDDHSGSDGGHDGGSAGDGRSSDSGDTERS